MTHRDLLRVILWMTGALLSFSTMAVSIRELSRVLSIFEVLALRSALGLTILGMIMLARPDLRGAMRTQHIWLHLMRNGASRPQRLPVWLGKANELIRNRFNEPLPVHEIARSVHIHPGHLAREYMRHYSCTISEQIRRLRVEYACRQLSDTSQCLADIALDAGFSDQSHFTVSFKQQIGVTPSDYRKAVKGMLHSQKNVSSIQDQQ